MKRAFYIFCFSILGVLLALIVRALLELALLSRSLGGFDRYDLGLSVILFVLGLWWGYANGVKYWNIIYVEKRFGWPPSWKRKFGKKGRSIS